MPASSSAAHQSEPPQDASDRDRPLDPDSTAIVPSGPAGAGRYSEGSVVAQKYRLVRVLGEGGMGAVWVAQNLTLGVQVALKLIRSEIEGRVDGLSERLLTEARAAAAIGHPAIIQVFDFGLTEQSDPFIAMELLRGDSLSSVLKKRGRIAAGRAVRTLLPVIEALVVANQRGIVHRDIKPDNIFLAQQANRVQPKVLDFGIAKLSQTFSANLTSEGTVLGSPAYMSPEQARGEPDVDFRTDMWALCVVLYEMITGVQPFIGSNWHGLMWAIMEGKPKPLGEHGIEEPGLWQILERGLAKEREARFPTMFELGQALAIWLVEQGVTRDICNSALKATWLERSPNSSAALHSFFPSDSPQSSEASSAPEAPLGAPGQDSAEEAAKPANPAAAVAVEPQSQIRRSSGNFRARASGSPTATRGWLLATVVGALVSFSAAVAYSLSATSSSRAADEDESVPSIVVREPSKNLGIAKRRDLLPGAAPLPPAKRQDDDDMLRQFQQAARAATSSARKPATKAAPSPAPRQTPAAAKRPSVDLKDPFSK